LNWEIYNGEDIEATTGSCALDLPIIIRTPVSKVLASLKTNIISDIPRTPCRKLSSATKNLSLKRSIIRNNSQQLISFDTTINVSTCFRSSSSASSLTYFDHRRRSNEIDYISF